MKSNKEMAPAAARRPSEVGTFVYCLIGVLAVGGIMFALSSVYLSHVEPLLGLAP